MRGVDFSSWGTPRVGTGKGYGSGGSATSSDDRSRLENQAANFMWKTAKESRGGYRQAGGKRYPNLAGQAQGFNWPTAVASDSKGCRNTTNTGATLTDAIQGFNWPTAITPHGGPERRNKKDARGSGGSDLQTAVKEWNFPTPDASQAKAGMQTRDGKRGMRLGTIAKEFMLMPEQQPSLFSRQENANWNSGERSLANTPNSLRLLSPNFQDWLMGWPIGSTAFGWEGWASYHWWQRMRWSLYGIVCGREGMIGLPSQGQADEGSPPTDGSARANHEPEAGLESPKMQGEK